MRTTATSASKPRGTEPAKLRILAALPAGWFLPMDAIHPEVRRPAIEELEAEGLVVRIPGSRDVIMSVVDAGSWDVTEAMTADSVSAVLASGVNMALRRLQSGEPLRQTDMQQMTRARVVDRTPTGLVLTQAGHRRLALLADADRRLSEGRPARRIRPSLYVVPALPPVPSALPQAEDVAPASARRSRVRHVARAHRLAAIAAARSGGRPEEHLGEAWLVANKSWTASFAADEILARDARGLIAYPDTTPGIDPDIIGARHASGMAIVEMVCDEDARMRVARALLSLTPREHRVLSLRYNLTADRGGLAPTLGEVAPGLDMSPERVRQIEAKALRRLRHPAIAARLRSLFDDVHLPGRSDRP